MGLLDKIESVIENLLEKDSSQADCTPEERAFHRQMLQELQQKYGLEPADGIIVANKIYAIPKHLGNRFYFRPPMPNPDSPLPTSPMLRLYGPQEQREYTKRVLYSMMDDRVYTGVKCCKADDNVFVEVIKNYEGISDKLLCIDGRHKWVLFGLEVAEKNTHSGESYFRLESPVSNQKLEEYTTAIKVAKMSQPINLYLKGRTGKHIPLKLKQKLPADFQHLEQAIFTDGKYVYMPQEINQLPSKPLNERFAWRASTHEAGHITEGSFKINVDKVDGMMDQLKERYKDNKEVQERMQKKEERKKKLEEKKRQRELEIQNYKEGLQKAAEYKRQLEEEKKKRAAGEQAKFEEAFREKVGDEKFEKIVDERRKMMEGREEGKK